MASLESKFYSFGDAVVVERHWWCPLSEEVFGEVVCERPCRYFSFENGSFWNDVDL